jgi:hypothetical protein
MEPHSFKVKVDLLRLDWIDRANTGDGPKYLRRSRSAHLVQRLRGGPSHHES